MNVCASSHTVLIIPPDFLNKVGEGFTHREGRWNARSL